MELNESLKIVGRVAKETLNKLFPGKEFHKQNAEWFFVSYAPVSYPIDSTFDFYTDSNAHGRTKDRVVNIKIRRIVDQFLNELDEIPQGYKTICRLEFSDHIPVAFKELPALKDWKPNPDSLFLFQLKNIQTPSNSLVSWAYSQLAITVYLQLKEQNIHYFNSQDVAHLLPTNYPNEEQGINTIMRYLVSEGKAKKTNESEEKLVLVK